jgi:ATP-dependent protease Clp ATPase subunit
MSDATCAFCSRTMPRAVHLVAGPSIFICDACVIHAMARMVQPDASADPGEGASPGESASQRYCSFCGKPDDLVRCLALCGKAGICNECVFVCLEVILDGREGGRRIELPTWVEGAG